VRQLDRQRPHGRDRSRHARLRPALGERRLAHTEPQTLYRDSSLAKAAADIIREHRELVRPDAVGNAQEQRALLERDGLRALGDACPDGLAP